MTSRRHDIHTGPPRPILCGARELKADVGRVADEFPRGERSWLVDVRVHCIPGIVAIVRASLADADDQASIDSALSIIAQSLKFTCQSLSSEITQR